MKMPRRRFWVPLVLAAALCACAWFNVHYHFIGWWRGDAYYQGLPTSYWHNTAAYQIHGPPKWLGPIRGWFSSMLARTESLAVFRGDPKSVPVLIQIIEDPTADSFVRGTAIESLSRLNEKAPDELLDALRKHLQPPNDQLRYFAAWQLLKRDDDPTLAVKVLFDWNVVNLSKDPTPSYRERAVIILDSLATCSPNIDPRPMLDVLRTLENDSDTDVRNSAVEAIQKIRKFHDGKR